MVDSSRRSAEQRFLGLVVTMFGLLAVQNIAGIWLNLFVSVSDTSSYSGVYPAMFRSAAGVTHTIVGVLIGANAILALVAAGRLNDRRAWPIATASLALVGVAAYLGFHFVQSGGDNLYSFAMETCFLGVVLSQAALLYLASQGPGRSATAGATQVAPAG